MRSAVSGRFDTLPELMDAAARQIGKREAYVDGDRRMSFAEWVRAADGVAGLLAARGVERGDVVGLHLDPSIDYAVLCAAIVRLGAVATGINPRLGPSERRAISERCRPRLVVSRDRTADESAWAGGVEIPLTEIVAAESRSPRPPLAGVEPHEPVCIIWTSGTTGAPKGAWFDHRNQRAAVAAGGAMTEAFDRRISAIPMVHAGYMSKLWEQFEMGVTMVLSPTPWTAESMLACLVEERITVAAGVPTQWAKLVEQPEIEKADLSALRIGLVATAPATPELVERVVRTIGCPLVVRYAMTECPSITGTEPGDPADVQNRTVGRAQAGMQVEIVDEAGQPLAAGETGRIRVRGPCVMRGYWEDPERTADVLSADAVLSTSDLGRIDPDGHLVLAGRLDDMYIRGGYNVYPVEVENALSKHPAVGQAAVVGLATEVIGEIGVAFVVPVDPETLPSLEVLRDFVAKQLADYKRPDRLEILEALPLTAMLKIDKNALRARLG